MEDLRTYLTLDRSFEESAALNAAESSCEVLLLRAPSNLASAEGRFRESLLLQVAGYLVRAGHRLPRPQWLAATLGMSSLEHQIEGWNALVNHKYRVALVLLRPVFEASLYVQACAVLPDFADNWFANKLRPGTVRKILDALRPKVGLEWVGSLKSNWDALNELAHANIFPTLAASIDAQDAHGLRLPGIPVGGGVANEELAVAISTVYAETAKEAMVAQGLCVVAPREQYPLWYVRHDELLGLAS